MISNDTFVRMQLIANPSIFLFTVCNKLIIEMQQQNHMNKLSKLYSNHWWIENSRKKKLSQKHHQHRSVYIWNRVLFSPVARIVKRYWNGLIRISNRTVRSNNIQHFVVNMNKCLPFFFAFSACALNDCRYHTNAILFLIATRLLQVCVGYKVHHQEFVRSRFVFFNTKIQCKIAVFTKAKFKRKIIAEFLWFHTTKTNQLIR